MVPFAEDVEVGAPNDDLAAAIGDVYVLNPELGRAREELRATDANLASALAETRASARAEIGAEYRATNPGALTGANLPFDERLRARIYRRNDLDARIIVDQPLFTWGRGAAAVRAARGDIAAGREALRATEGDLLGRLISAYVEVRFGTRVLHVRAENERVLAATLEEVIARRDAGELTRTDIAQAQTQLETARVQSAIAEAELERARASFRELTGRDPGALAPEPPLPDVPTSIDEAFALATERNPDLASAIAAERASRARIAVARAAGLPRLDAQATADTTGPLTPLRREDRDVAWGARATLSIPLFAGGRVAADIERAAARNGADSFAVEATRRRMVAAIVDAWNRAVTAERNIVAQRAQLASARIFYEGTYSEYREGLRSTFDVLYAQTSLRDTEIALLASLRDRYTAEASLLRSVGLLEAGQLVRNLPSYDFARKADRIEGLGAQPTAPLIRAIDSIAAPSERRPPLAAPPPSAVPLEPKPGAGIALPDTLIRTVPPVWSRAATPGTGIKDRK